MREEDKQQYLERYAESKKRGIPFWPDALFKDAVVGLLTLLVIVGLSAIVGAELGDRADPSDDGFTPRPEWYFLYLFQLLKYFPGSLEWVGVILFPAVALALLIALPWLDRSPRRHILSRPWVLGSSLAIVVFMVTLTILAVLEKPPPQEMVLGDPVAALYTENCSGCHGGSITVPAGVDLTAVIAQGSHQNMPAWSADLSVDEIDALAGFILSPNGAAVFQSSCSDCHQAADLAEGDPLRLRSAVDSASDFEPHAGLEIDIPGPSEGTALLNFLIAPDGERLFTLNCATCHGSAPAFDGTQEELREIIETGGGHESMPAMAGILSEEQIESLVAYVTDPGAHPNTEALFEQNCTVCHGDRIPSSESAETALAAITMGGSHETMPVWGDILTDEQLDALTLYAFEAAEGSPLILGQELFAANCAVCHGDFGEGGPNPANPTQTLAPISTAEYLATRDDFTLRAIISQGQPNQGMSPFSLSFGGPLDTEEIDAIVIFIRSWQADPPVELPPDFERAPFLGSAGEVYTQFCTQCHGDNGEGGIGPSFQSAEFHATRSDEGLFRAIDTGHAATAMIAWGQILTNDQIEDLVELLRTFEGGPGDPGDGDGGEVSFSGDVLPIFEARCVVCHGASGGWAADSYTSVMESGNSAPVVIPGDPEGSNLGQWLLGTHPNGFMPPGGSLPADEVQTILDWIAAGALDN
jgi:mono/diheme cytochrome c family protein